MATHIPKSRKVVRQYLKQQWDTMVGILGDPFDASPIKEKEARLNFVEFEKALSFPYNQKLAYFPADTSLEEVVGEKGRARGIFGEGSLIAFEWGKQAAAHQSAMLASLYARQEFIRAAARMPMTLFIGPSSLPPTDLDPTPFPDRGTLLTSEKFSRVVFSGFIALNNLEYVAVVQLSRTYPQTAVVRMWSTYKGNKKQALKSAIKAMKTRWLEIAGDANKPGNILFQRGSYANKGGIPLLTSGLDREEDTQEMYIKQVDSESDMWANVIAATASDKHGDTNLLDTATGRKLWKQEGLDKDDVGMSGDEWMAAMLALRRIPYIVKSEDSDNSNKDPFPHALTHGEAKLVKDMMTAIIARNTQPSQTTNTEESSSSNSSDSIPILNKLSTKQMDSQRRRQVVFSKTVKWWLPAMYLREKRQPKKTQQIMTDADVISMSAADIKTVLNEVVVPKGDSDTVQKIYGKSYKEFMETLQEDEGNIRGLMSQAIVPRLIRQMAKIPQKKRTIQSELKAELILKADKDITPDYPYARTQIIEVWAKIKTGKGLNLYEIFKDPLLVTAVEITNALMGKEATELGTQRKREKFSLGVNKVQDVILRNMIQDEQGVIPMFGDTTLPFDGTKRDWEEDQKKGLAFGLGENPNPEVAAILNPALVMTGAEQKQYHQELATLARLISPEDQDNLTDRSVGDVFKNVGFTINGKENDKESGLLEDEILEFGGPNMLGAAKDLAKNEVEGVEAKLQKEIGVLRTILKEEAELRGACTIKIEKLESDLEQEQRRSKTRGETIKQIKQHQMDSESKLKKEIKELKEKLKSLPETKDDDDDDDDDEEEEEEAKTDYNALAMNFLIGYLRVPDDIYKLTKNWKELYALPNYKGEIFKEYIDAFKDDDDDDDDDEEPEAEDVLRVGLSSLIVTHEKIGVMRPPYYLEDEDAEVTLDHTKIINLWRAAIGIDDDDKPNQKDLVIQKPELGPKGIAIAKAIEQALLNEKKKVASFLPKQQPRLSNRQINASTERRRSKQKRNRKDERVLIW